MEFEMAKDWFGTWLGISEENLRGIRNKNLWQPNFPIDLGGVETRAAGAQLKTMLF